jgi:hypothetical protein
VCRWGGARQADARTGMDEREMDVGAWLAVPLSRGRSIRSFHRQDLFCDRFYLFGCCTFRSGL